MHVFFLQKIKKGKKKKNAAKGLAEDKKQELNITSKKKPKKAKTEVQQGSSDAKQVAHEKQKKKKSSPGRMFSGVEVVDMLEDEAISTEGHTTMHTTKKRKHGMV